MKARTGFVVIALLGLMFVAVGSRPALADEYTCTGRLGAVTVDNLRVPEGRTCRLIGTVVEGTIKVENNATLLANRVRVDGNVQAEGAKMVKVLNRSTVGGSIQIVQGGGAVINHATVEGDILFDENSKSLKAVKNTVGGNIQAFKNDGGVVITNNTVDGNLQCKENSPAPRGGRNTVHGSKEDQCSRL